MRASETFMLKPLERECPSIFPKPRSREAIDKYRTMRSNTIYIIEDVRTNNGVCSSYWK